MLASCSSPPGRYQQAAIHIRDGVPCFGVPDTKETRVNAPVITGVSVTEPGGNGLPMWEHDFLRDGTGEPTLPPSQCIKYGEGVASVPSLLTGKRYQVVLWGRTPGVPGRKGEADARVFSVCFQMVEVSGKVIKPVVSDCSTALPAGQQLVRMEDR